MSPESESRRDDPNRSGGPRKVYERLLSVCRPQVVPTCQQDVSVRTKQRAHLAVATIVATIVVLWSWWHSVDKTLEAPWAFILGSLVIILAAALMIGYLHFARLADVEEKDVGWVLVPFYLAFMGAFFDLLWKAMAVRSMSLFVDISLWIHVDAFLLLYRVLESADRRLRQRHTDLWIAWRRSGRHRQFARGGLMAVILTFVAGAAFIYNGYTVLNSPPPFGGYPYSQSAEPLYNNYTTPAQNMTLQVNITLTTSKEEFVVGEFIWTKVKLTAVNVDPNVTTPYLETVAFPTDDEWDFRFYQSYSGSGYSLGDQLTAEGSRFFPETGEYHLVQDWTVLTGARNETIPVFMNLTIRDRAAIEAFEREREQFVQIYLEYSVLLRQEGYNLVLIGVSLIFGAALVPALVDLLTKAFSRRRGHASYVSRAKIGHRRPANGKR